MKLYNQIISDTPRFNTLINVTELSNHDMIYVYHLLSIGTKIKLYKTEKRLNGSIIYKVYFHNFLLGFAELSKLKQSFFAIDDVLEGTISKLSKEKYLPINNLEICVHNKQLKLVS